ncbi:MAG: phycobilisome protein [Cyanothece sp. SIO1E1]|nr:phycobilisome protein [Cyanothece sp. SIO1E1]
MYPELEAILEQAEDQYLSRPQLESFGRNIASLAQRLKTYEFLRDQEIVIFQSIADQLQMTYAKEEQQILERVLKHGVLVLRHCAMAMLLNNPELLQLRLLGWLKGLAQTYQTQTFDVTLFQLLQTHLKELLPANQFALLEPLLSQVQAVLWESSTAIAI